MRNSNLIIILLLFPSLGLFAQNENINPTDTIDVEQIENNNPSKFEINGYLKDLVSVAIPSFNGLWSFDNQIHNRVNFKYYANSWLTLNAEARNRIYFGNSVQQIPNFDEQVNQSLDYIRLGGIVSQGQSYLIHSTIDRANLKLDKDKWQAIIGKQRINWGKTYAWNPNDLFNAYSFFDFDYEERRGTDAALVKYNISSLSSIEFASNIDSTFDKMIFATNYKTNIKEYDFQFLVGKYKTDIALGAGWAGQIKNAGFKGELTYFQPYKNVGVNPTFIGDISFDYTLPNTLNFRLEFIGNTNPIKTTNIQFFTQPVFAKGLINNYVSTFISVGYDITPLIKANLNSIWNIDDNSIFLNPTIDFSLTENTNLLIAAQIFTGDKNSLYNGVGSYVFTRLKWSF